MKFTVITPSLNQLAYLRRCIASVADQTDIQVEHVVIDGGSTDGTIAWLTDIERQSAANYRLTFISEPDEGMYDALNKGFERASGDVLAWLNCDEQYLPGALHQVMSFLETHPSADFVYGDALLVDPEGTLLTCRKNPPLRRAYVLADHLYTQSAAMFFRAGIFGAGHRFNAAWKAVGDCDFVIRMLTAGFRPAQIKDYLAVCTMTGLNISRGSSGVNELEKFRQQAPLIFRAGRPVFNTLRYFEKFLRGGYRQATPLEYDLCVDDSNVRKKFVSETASSRFKWGGHE